MYCDQEHAHLQVDHIRPKAKIGTNWVSNLELAYELCNRKKVARDERDSLMNVPGRLKRILDHAKRPLKDAAAANATRWTPFGILKATELPVEVASGECTKFNRTHLSIPKEHALDVVCVGAVEAVQRWQRS